MQALTTAIFRRIRLTLACAWVASLTAPALSAAPAVESPEAAAGKGRFEKLCIACHGKAGEGRAARAPSLQQRPDLTTEFIRTRIIEGKHGDHAMPPWGTVLDAAAIDALVAYVGWLAGHPASEAATTLTPFALDDPERIAAGRKRFNKTCAGYCHGYDGSGGRAPDFKGRPDLDPQFLYDTIYHGREGTEVMPAWGDALPDATIWELVAFLRHLGRQPAD